MVRGRGAIDVCYKAVSRSTHAAHVHIPIQRHHLHIAHALLRAAPACASIPDAHHPPADLDSLCPRGAQAAKCVVSRLMHLGKCIGTAVRVAWAAGDEPMGDIVLTARHCVEEGGACLSGLCAFDGDLAFLAARPDLDVAVFRGPRGRGLRLMQHALLPGGDIWLLSFPLPVELEFAATSAAAAGAGGAAAATAATADEVPTVDRGTVSRIGPTGLSAVASFNTGTCPNLCGWRTRCPMQGPFASVRSILFAYHIQPPKAPDVRCPLLPPPLLPTVCANTPTCRQACATARGARCSAAPVHWRGCTPACCGTCKGSVRPAAAPAVVAVAPAPAARRQPRLSGTPRACGRRHPTLQWTPWMLPPGTWGRRRSSAGLIFRTRAARPCSRPRPHCGSCCSKLVRGRATRWR